MIGERLGEDSADKGTFIQDNRAANVSIGVDYSSEKKLWTLAQVHFLLAVLNVRTRMANPERNPPSGIERVEKSVTTRFAGADVDGRLDDARRAV